MDKSKVPRFFSGTPCICTHQYNNHNYFQFHFQAGKLSTVIKSCEEHTAALVVMLIFHRMM